MSDSKLKDRESKGTLETLNQSKGLAAEFKEFIMRGNVMDMAIGIIIGGAFTAIVNSLVKDIFTPLLGILIGGLDFSGLKITVGGAEVLYGVFIQNVVSFLIVAFVVFMCIKALNKITRRKKVEEVVEEAVAEPSDEVKLLTEIRDALVKSQN